MHVLAGLGTKCVNVPKSASVMSIVCACALTRLCDIWVHVLAERCKKMQAVHCMQVLLRIRRCIGCVAREPLAPSCAL